MKENPILKKEHPVNNEELIAYTRIITRLKKKNMREHFQIIKDQIGIESVAQHLLGQPVRGMYFFPGERTPSIKIYPKTESFFDFGRGIGGDCIKLWSHIRHCDSWTALQEIVTVFGVSTALNETNRKSIVERIKTQEQAQKEREQAEKRAKKLWVSQVDKLHEELELYDNLLNSPHIPPLSWVWTWCMNGKQLAEYKLDYLCGVLD